ncbi:MAG: NUDIX domain-containing protein [Candidatus Staskawiczbacteria bacterium]|nr:NUDIX domain-containing protein [Candidatus Staskawiczbacteria bacterium]
MHRQSFLQILKEYNSTADSEEKKVISELIDYVTNNPDCFKREPKEGAKHIATSVLLVTKDFKKALFLWHAKIQRWTQPGGHADGNPDLQSVSLKELEEETGIHGAQIMDSVPLDIYRFDYPPEVFGYRKSIYNLFFVAFLPEGQEPKIIEPEKCKEMRWATPEEALEMIKVIHHEGTERLIKKWQNLANKKEARQ